MRRIHESVSSEWRHLLKNKMLLISCLVILFIPIMYGGFFLGSIWDPYGKTSNLPVVVVNEDDGAELNGEAINIGKDVIEQLKGNDNLEWHFESAYNAERHMRNNKYYMLITIPKDFSQNAASVSSDHPKQSIIKYTVAASKNYIGTVVDKEAVAKLKNNVSEKLSKAYVRVLLSNISQLANGLNQASAGSSKITQGAERALSGARSLTGALKDYTDGVGKLSSGQISLNSGLMALEKGSAQLQSAINAVNSGLPSESEIATLKSGLNSVALGLGQLNTQLSFGTNNSILRSDLNNVGGNLDLISQKLGDPQGAAVSDTLVSLIKNSAATDLQKSAMLDVVDQVNVEIKAASTALDDNNSATTDDIAGQLSLIDYQAAQMQQTVSQLNTGMSLANTGVQQVLGGLDLLRGGSSEILAGSKRLTSSISVALAGSNQLLDGVSILNASSSALNDGGLQLQNGLWGITNGSTMLTSKLVFAASQIKLQSVDSVSEHIASPVSTTESSQGKVPNYGHALAPYVLSLGLFVGALVFNFIYPIKKAFGLTKNGFNLWLSKFSIGFVVAILQATILDIIMLQWLGLKPDNMGGFFAMTYATSNAYMAIVMFLSIALDNPGRFIAMVLLVLQLGGSGGTFPLQLSGKFFQTISQYLPMTYSILGFRQAISSGLGDSVFWSSLALLSAITIVFNLFIWVTISLYRRVSIHGYNLSQLD